MIASKSYLLICRSFSLDVWLTGFYKGLVRAIKHFVWNEIYSTILPVVELHIPSFPPWSGGNELFAVGGHDIQTLDILAIFPLLNLRDNRPGNAFARDVKAFIGNDSL